MVTPVEEKNRDLVCQLVFRDVLNLRVAPKIKSAHQSSHLQAGMLSHMGGLWVSHRECISSWVLLLLFLPLLLRFERVSSWFCACSSHCHASNSLLKKIRSLKSSQGPVLNFYLTSIVLPFHYGLGFPF